MNKLDDSLTNDIRSGGHLREKALKAIYYDDLCRNAVKKFVLNNRGNEFDVEDVYQESMLILDRKIRSGDFKNQSKASTFLIGIARYYWLNKMRKMKPISLSEEDNVFEEVDFQTPEKVQITLEQKSHLEMVINSLGEGCRKLLTLWKLSYSMEEISHKLGLSSAKYARKKKYRCMKSLMDTIKKDQLFNELFT